MIVGNSLEQRDMDCEGDDITFINVDCIKKCLNYT